VLQAELVELDRQELLDILVVLVVQDKQLLLEELVELDRQVLLDILVVLVEQVLAEQAVQVKQAELVEQVKLEQLAEQVALVVLALEELVEMERKVILEELVVQAV